MQRALLFTLYAPLAAFGDIAVGERRVGYDRPGRSAVLGLLSAADGIKRDDEAALDALDRAWALALRVESAGALLQDYHTVQSRPSGRNKSWTTRREMLANKHEIETLLSLRDYRCDPLITVALFPRDPALADADRLAGSLATPAFTLYLGRKACPLGLPPRPLIVQADSLADAFAAYDAQRSEPEKALRAALRLKDTRPRIYADTDLEAHLAPAFRIERVERRRDAPVNRRRWQFTLRDELVALPATTEAAS